MECLEMMLHLATFCLLLFITRTLYFYGKRKDCIRSYDRWRQFGCYPDIRRCTSLPRFIFNSTFSSVLPIQTCFLLRPSPDIYFVMMEFYGFISLFQRFFFSFIFTQKNNFLSLFFPFSEEFFIKINKNTRMPWAAFKKPFIFDRRLHVSTIQRLWVEIQ